MATQYYYGVGRRKTSVARVFLTEGTGKITINDLIVKAVGFGLLGFAAFVVAHWLCDLLWLWFLSGLAYKGGQFFGGRFQKVLFVVCAVFLLFVGGKFIVEAVGAMRG